MMRMRSRDEGGAIRGYDCTLASECEPNIRSNSVMKPVMTIGTRDRIPRSWRIVYINTWRRRHPLRNEFGFLVMHEITKTIAAIRRVIDSGKRGILVTIIDTRGSTYRRAGARAVIAEDGESFGTTSGGCRERDLADRVAARPA